VKTSGSSNGTTVPSFVVPHEVAEEVVARHEETRGRSGERLDAERTELLGGIRIELEEAPRGNRMLSVDFWHLPEVGASPHR
jgi:hypothetical protein